MQEIQMGKYIDYQLLDSNIHQILWKDHKVEATFEFIKITKQLLAKFPSDSTALILQDFRHTTAPSFRLLMDAMAKSGSRNDVTLRVAYIGSDSSLQLIIKGLTTSNNVGGNRAFFKPDEEDKAIAWLLKE